jgi:SET domain-containing protein
MIQVKTYIDKSPIHGIGLFANEPIAAGTLIWRFTEGVDRWVEYHTIKDLMPHELDFIDNAATYDDETDSYCLVGDNIRFMNHSNEANCGETDDTSDTDLELFALRDIAKGEELTLDYGSLEEDSDDFSDEVHGKFNEKL